MIERFCILDEHGVELYKTEISPAFPNRVLRAWRPTFQIQILTICEWLL